MVSKKEKRPFPEVYEPPRLFHITTEFQQALGLTYCAVGFDASGGPGVCNTGFSATGDPMSPNACSAGHGAMVGPGHGNSPCGPGFGACSTG